MGLKLLHPQEVEVFYILPALRKEFAISFKALGTSQTKIAQIMGVTDAAISQYLSDKRATDVSFTRDVKSQIKKAAGRIKEQAHFIYETQILLNDFLKSKLTCKIHLKMNPNIPRDCDTCFGGK